MPVDPRRLLGAELPEATWRWGPDELLLYHLALGAGGGDDPAAELAWTYERDLVPLPTYAAVTAVPQLMGVFDLPGLDFDPGHVLHGSHELTVARPLPRAGEVRHRARVEALHDLGRHGLAVVHVASHDVRDDALMFENRFHLFLAGQGGFGGTPAPASTASPPGRAPDAQGDVTLLPQQALMFRLTGDKHPVHVDPAVARARGFPRPILHGLCTFGVAARFVVQRCAGGDPSRLTGFAARFTREVYPGETLALAAWREGARVHVSARSRERDVDVLGAATARLAP